MVRGIACFLAVGIGTVQAVRLEDCPCIAVCRCGERECTPAQGPPHLPAKGGCCGEDTGTPSPESVPHKDQGCTHVEPPGDILPEEGLSPTAPLLTAPVGLPEALPPAAGPAPRTNAPLYDARGSPDLYLLNSVLLI